MLSNLNLGFTEICLNLSCSILVCNVFFYNMGVNSNKLLEYGIEMNETINVKQENFTHV